MEGKLVEKGEMNYHEVKVVERRGVKDEENV